MPEITLWAPSAERADAHLVGDGFHVREVVPMEFVDDEHFSINLPAGTRYLLSVDGGTPRPDPRSLRQPLGVHGPSEVVDVTAFAWSDADWPGVDVLGKVLYELHVGTFTPEGTLDAAIGRLPHLVALGVQLVELMPLAAFPGARGWGYDGVDLYAVHEPYGGPEALVRFVDAAHAHGLGVCLDVVHNHFGPSGNYTATFGPYLTDKHASAWGAGINLDDQLSHGVREFIVENCVHWLRDFHVDALRLDAVHALEDDSPRHILAELSDAVAELSATVGLPKALIAESDLNDVRMLAPTAEGGYGMTAQWADDVHHALHSYLTGERFGIYVDFGAAETLAHALTRVFVHEGTFSTFRGKVWGAPVPDEVDRRRFVVFSENHDQVGNRALGDRPSHRSRAVAAAAAAVVLLGPFTPMLFQGQEWGAATSFQFFTDHDAELGQAVRDGRRAEFSTHGWQELYGDDLVVPDPQAEATWRASVLDWAEPAAPPGADLLAWHRALAALRAEHLGTPHTVAVRHGAGWFELVHGPLRVLLGVGPDEVVVPDAAPPAAPAPARRVLLTWGTATVVPDGVRLGADSVVVLGN